MHELYFKAGKADVFKNRRSVEHPLWSPPPPPSVCKYEWTMYVHTHIKVSATLSFYTPSWGKTSIARPLKKDKLYILILQMRCSAREGLKPAAVLSCLSEMTSRMELRSAVCLYLLNRSWRDRRSIELSSPLSALWQHTEPHLITWSFKLTSEHDREPGIKKTSYILRSIHSCDVCS